MEVECNYLNWNQARASGVTPSYVKSALGSLMAEWTLAL